MGVSGGYLYRARRNVSQYTLELSELPSFRTGRASSRFRELRFDCEFTIGGVAVDASQGLLVIGELFRPVFVFFRFDGDSLDDPFCAIAATIWYGSGFIFGICGQIHRIRALPRGSWNFLPNGEIRDTKFPWMK